MSDEINKEVSATEIVEKHKCYVNGINVGIEMTLDRILRLKRKLEFAHEGRDLSLMHYSLLLLHDDLSSMIYKDYKPISKGYSSL